MVAIAWTLEEPAMTAAIVGSRSASRLRVAGRGNLQLGPAEFAEIGKFLTERP